MSYGGPVHARSYIPVLIAILAAKWSEITNMPKKYIAIAGYGLPNMIPYNLAHMANPHLLVVFLVLQLLAPMEINVNTYLTEAYFLFVGVWLVRDEL